MRNHLQENAELVVCMGDTLVHLPDNDSVASLVRNCADSLSGGGSIILTLRDYTQPPPTGPARFMPVRSDDEWIFTCFFCPRFYPRSNA